MSQAKNKYFEVLVREEQMVKYNVKANDEEQAQRLLQQHQEIYEQNRQVVAHDKYIIDTGEVT
jgi:hypothetical protein